MNNTPSTATREEFIGSCNIVIRSCGSDAHAIRVATELKRLLEQQPAVTVSEGELLPLCNWLIEKAERGENAIKKQYEPVALALKQRIENERKEPTGFRQRLGANGDD
jgi:hypothetical protein